MVVLSLSHHTSQLQHRHAPSTLSPSSLSVHTAGGPGQAHLLPSGGAQPLQVTLTHDRALACPSDRVWRGRREPEASWRAGRLWTPSAQPASPLNSVSDLLRVFPCVTLPSIQVVAQTNTTCLPSQSRAELHQKVCGVVVVQNLCRVCLVFFVLFFSICVRVCHCCCTANELSSNSNLPGILQPNGRPNQQNPIPSVTLAVTGHCLCASLKHCHLTRFSVDWLPCYRSAFQPSVLCTTSPS